MKKKRWLVVLAALAGVAVLAALALVAAMRYWHGLTAKLEARRAAPPTIVVDAVYPGANARVLADTVAAPIEQQVNGVENFVRLRSRCDDDGTYSLAVTFKPGTDLNIAQVLVQNRVALAQPVLPELVTRAGVAIRKKSPAVRALLALTSPTGRYDELYLSNYAAIRLRDELLRLPGVGDVALLGRREYGVQVWLEPDKIAALGLTVTDIVGALDEQKLQTAAGAVGAADGKPVALTVTGIGRLQDPEDLGKIVVKTAPGGTPIYLRDLARVELGSSGDPRSVRFDGRPAVALAIHPLGPDIDANALDGALQTLLQRLRNELPDGLALDVAFGFPADAAPDAILVDVELPAAAATERILEALEQCDNIIRKIDGVTKTLTTTDDPFAAPRARPCVLASVDPNKKGRSRDQLVSELRRRLHDEVTGASVRINDLATPGRATPGGYPIAFATCDIADNGHEALAKVAGRIVQRLSESPQVTDVGTSPRLSDAPHLMIEIDRRQAAALGVAVGEIQNVLQIARGGVTVGPTGPAGRTWQVTVRGDPGHRDLESLKHLQVAGANGQRVPLSALASVQVVSGPTAVERLDMYPSIEISANAAQDVTPAAVRALCERIAAEDMSPGFRLTWLSRTPK